ncbi:MAG TPA: hypothetical protein VNM72_08720 [Blastocatellia bacterium]|nr:hypothetical protein [Blastocatellia bacterium]
MREQKDSSARHARKAEARDLARFAIPQRKIAACLWALIRGIINVLTHATKKMRLPADESVQRMSHPLEPFIRWDDYFQGGTHTYA